MSLTTGPKAADATASIVPLCALSRLQRWPRQDLRIFCLFSMLIGNKSRSSKQNKKQKEKAENSSQNPEEQKRSRALQKANIDHSQAIARLRVGFGIGAHFPGTGRKAPILP